MNGHASRSKTTYRRLCITSTLSIEYPRTPFLLQPNSDHILNTEPFAATREQAGEFDESAPSDRASKVDRPPLLHVIPLLVQHRSAASGWRAFTHRVSSMDPTHIAEAREIPTLSIRAFVKRSTSVSNWIPESCDRSACRALASPTAWCHLQLGMIFGWVCSERLFDLPSR